MCFDSDFARWFLVVWLDLADIHPIVAHEVTYATFAITFGGFFYGYIVASLAAIIHSMDANEKVGPTTTQRSKATRVTLKRRPVLPTIPVPATDPPAQVKEEALDAVVAYMNLRNFQRPLFKKVYRYFSHYYEKKGALDEHEILGR